MAQFAEAAQRVDDCIAGDHDIFLRDALGQERVARMACGREVNARESRNQAAIGFFGKRIVNVVAAQARFDVTDGNFAIVGSERGAEGRGRVSLNKDHVRAKSVAGIFDRVDDAAGQQAERLIRAHHVQIEIRDDIEMLQHLIEHRAVLAGVNNGGLEFVRMAAQLVNDEGELNCLWPRSKDGDDSAFGAHARALLIKKSAKSGRTSPRWSSNVAYAITRPVFIRGFRGCETVTLG
jgi:hypothetical protein